MNLLHVDPDPCGSEHRELARLTDENASLRAAVQAVRELIDPANEMGAGMWGERWFSESDIRRALSAVPGTAADPARPSAAGALRDAARDMRAAGEVREEPYGSSLLNNADWLAERADEIGKEG
jgi:hypothetical protein